MKEFVDFFINNKKYLIFIAHEDDMVVSGMFVYMIPKTPKPGRCPKHIAF